MRYTIAELVAILSMDAKKFKQGLKGAEAATVKMARNVERISKRAMKMITLPILAIGTASVKMAMDFETQIKSLYTIMDEATIQSRDWAQEVLNLSKEIGESTNILATGLYDLIGSGIEAADAMGVLEIAAKAAKAGGTDTATAVKALAAVLNSYSLNASEAEKVSDTLFATVNYGVIRFEELAHGIGTVLPVAVAAGISLEEVGAALTVLTVGGIESSIAMTGLRAMIMGLLNPTPQAAEEAEKLGINLSAVALATGGLDGMLKELATQLGLDDEAMKELSESTLDEATVQEILARKLGTTTEAMAKIFPQTRALVTALSLLKGGGEGFSEQLKNIEGDTGAAGRAFEIMASTTQHQFNIMMSSLKATGIEIGTKLLPIVTKLFKGVGNLVGKFGEMSDAGQTAVVAVGGIAATIPILLYLSAKVMILVTQFKALGIAINTTKLASIGLHGVLVGAAIAAGKYMSWSYKEAIRMNKEYESIQRSTWLGIHEIGETVKRAEEEIAETTGDLTYVIEKHEDQIMDWRYANEDLIVVMQELRNEYDSQLITAEDYEKALQYLINTEGAYKGTTEEVLEKVGALTEEHVKLKKSSEEVGTALASEAKTIGELDFLLSEGIITTEQHAEATKRLGGAASDAAKSLNELFDVMFGVFNIEQSITEATWRYEEALKKVDELIKKGITSGREWKEATFALQDARQGLMNRIAEGLRWEDLDIEKQDELIGKYLEVSDASIKRGETSLAMWWEETKQMGFISEEIGRYLINMGSEAVTSGEISREQFNNMLSDFNILADGIGLEIVSKVIPSYDAMYRKGGELSDQEITPEIYIRDTQALSAIQNVDKSLSALDGKSATVSIRTRLEKFMSMGGIVKAMGGIVGAPKAAYGYIAPQTGREVPVIAHEGEVILNTSEQGNIAQWIMNKATTRPEGLRGVGNITNIFKIATLAVREEADVEKVAETFLELQESKQRGVGNK